MQTMVGDRIFPRSSRPSIERQAGVGSPIADCTVTEDTIDDPCLFSEESKFPTVPLVTVLKRLGVLV